VLKALTLLLDLELEGVLAGAELLLDGLHHSVLVELQKLFVEDAMLPVELSDLSLQSADLVIDRQDSGVELLRDLLHSRLRLRKEISEREKEQREKEEEKKT
jgi:hypothetical protein